MLSTSNLSVKYGRIEALSSVSLDLKPGSIVTVNGHHGAGKSSLLKALIGGVRYSGVIKLNGKTLKRPSPRKMLKNKVFLVPERSAIFDTLSVRENIQLAAITLKKSKNLTFVLKLFPELEPTLEHKAFSLSGGQKQIVSFCRCLMANPDFFLLDEPFLGLSEHNKIRISERIGILRDSGKSFLISGEVKETMVKADTHLELAGGKLFVKE
ncbi:MAG: hypothetical protein CML56_02530 [Rhodobacteraceae bacterium]|nr:hypothetical protein [Paracoccaceae bacterium]